MHPVLRLFEDTIAGGSPDVSLPALPRMIFIVHGSVTIAGKTLRDGMGFDNELTSAAATPVAEAKPAAKKPAGKK